MVVEQASSGKSMRVLIYSHAYPNPVEESRSAFVREIVGQLSEKMNVTVVAPVPYFLNRQRKKPQVSIPFHRKDTLAGRMIDVYHPRYLLLPKAILDPVVAQLMALTTFHCVSRLHRCLSFDLVQINWGFPDGVAGAMICRRLKLPYIITEHQGGISEYLDKPYYQKLLRDAYNHAASLITVSESLKQTIVKTPGIRKDITVIPNGIDLNLMSLREKRTQLSKLVYIGYLTPAKGIQYLLQALTILKAKGQNYSLDIIGNGAFMPVLQRMVKDLNLLEYIRFLGLYTAEEVRKALPDYDALVLPSLIESFGLVLIEAMACGLPVLSTYSGGPESIVTPETGVLVKPGSDSALAQGLAHLSERWASYEPDQIRAYCRAHFALENTCARLSEVFISVAGKHD